MSIAIPQLTKNLNHSVNGMLTERRMNYRDMPVTIQVIEWQSFILSIFLTFFLAQSHRLAVYREQLFMGSDPENFSHLFRTSRQLRKTQQSMVPTGISTCQSREEAIKNECLYSPYIYDASFLTLPNLVVYNMTS